MAVTIIINAFLSLAVFTAVVGGISWTILSDAHGRARQHSNASLRRTVVYAE